MRVIRVDYVHTMCGHMDSPLWQILSNPRERAKSTPRVPTILTISFSSFWFCLWIVRLVYKTRLVSNKFSNRYAYPSRYLLKHNYSIPIEKTLTTDFFPFNIQVEKTSNEKKKSKPGLCGARLPITPIPTQWSLIVQKLFDLRNFFKRGCSRILPRIHPIMGIRPHPNTLYIWAIN